MSLRRLFLIPARRGSKGLPGKNIKPLDNMPLIGHSIHFAKQCMHEGDELCVSTNDPEVVEVCEKMGVQLPFIRPDELASDTSSTIEVIEHALSHYRNNGVQFDEIVLLQPTSPFRAVSDFTEMAQRMANQSCDMVVSVKEVKDSPYFNLFIENSNGQLESLLSEDQKVSRRQDAPKAFAYNGSIYLFKTSSFEACKSLSFESVVKYVMPESRSVDIDTPADWNMAEYFLKISNENN